MSKVLVIKDDPDMVAVLHMPLEANGHELSTAPTGDQGLRKVIG